MADEYKEYQCDKCRQKISLATPQTFHVCGGKLRPAVSMQDIEEIFPWLGKDKK